VPDYLDGDVVACTKGGQQILGLTFVAGERGVKRRGLIRSRGIQTDRRDSISLQ
jgi:hypothetical protein